MGYIHLGLIALFFGCIRFVFLLNIDAPRRFFPSDLGKRILGKIDRKTQLEVVSYRTTSLAWLPWYVAFVVVLFTF